MIDGTTLKVGDMIVNFGRVQEVFKIEERKTTDGSSRKFVHFKPIFENTNGGSLSCSIPMDNVCKTCIRKPIDKQYTVMILEEVGRRMRLTEFPDTSEVNEMLTDNEPHNLIRALKILNRERKYKENGLSTSKKTLYERIIENLAQEFAYVKKTTPKVAYEEIEVALG